MNNPAKLLEKYIMKSKEDQVQYQKFNFSNLSSKEARFLSFLSKITKYESFILNRLRPKITTDMKISFLEKYSMQVGTAKTAQIEQQRLAFLYSLQAFPYLALSIG
jgi:hypothetical protein